MKFYMWVIAASVCLPLLFSSCYTSKNIPYFQDLKDTTKLFSQSIKESYEAHIQPDDVIEIIVNSVNPQATAIFNLGNNTPGGAGAGASSTNALATTTRSAGSGGYLVNKEGIIDFPVLGKILVKGLGTSQLKDTLARMLDPYLKNPIINVRLMNYKITVLGEVARPASYTFPSERVSVVDAIGMAGDLTISGKRDNILLVREENGQRNFIRLNLNSSKIFESPYYYLKQNDIVYVEPSRSKIAATDTETRRNLAIFTSLLTLIVVLIRYI